MRRIAVKLLLISFQTLSDVRKARISSQLSRKRKVGHAKIITISPYKRALEQFSVSGATKSGKRKKLREDLAGEKVSKTRKYKSGVRETEIGNRACRQVNGVRAIGVA